MPSGKKFSNKLTDAEVERLACLAEECGEVVQIVMKILRHGYESHHPRGGDSNRSLLEIELGDVLGIIDMMVTSADVEHTEVQNGRESKLENMEKYLHHQDIELLTQKPGAST